MEKKLKLLIIEDVSADAELMERELQKGGISINAKRIETREALIEAIDGFDPDLILSDYNLPKFDGLSALAIAQEKRPDIPFIVVSGAIGEELAVEALKKGATDYVLKDHLAKLVPAVSEH